MFHIPSTVEKPGIVAKIVSHSKYSLVVGQTGTAAIAVSRYRAYTRWNAAYLLVMGYIFVPVYIRNRISYPGGLRMRFNLLQTTLTFDIYSFIFIKKRRTDVEFVDFQLAPKQGIRRYVFSGAVLCEVVLSENR
jgi:hypothetical protein